MSFTISQYYFTENLNCLKGLRLNSGGDIITFYGPFTSFDKETRILQTEKGDKLYLPERESEKSKLPNLFERTKTQLQRLSQ
jgi:hypothetical protein